MEPKEDKTNPNSKGDAQRRADQIRSFQAELKLIEDEKIISLDEAMHRHCLITRASLKPIRTF
jgi:hypothetical protein